MPARIAIVTTVEMPLPDPDEELLLPLLPEAALVAWDDADVDWASFDVVVLRSTWNYAAHLDEFLAWATREAFQWFLPSSSPLASRYRPTRWQVTWWSSPPLGPGPGEPHCSATTPQARCRTRQGSSQLGTR